MGVFFKQLRAGVNFAAGDAVAKQMANYAYVIGDTATGKALIVDPAYAPGELLEITQNEGFEPQGIILTHFHADHAGGTLYADSHPPIPGIKELLEIAAVDIHVQNAEAEWLEKTTGVGKDSLRLHDSGDQIELGNTKITLIRTPGHTPGSQCILLENAILTGDTLFLRGCGRSDLPGADPGDLYDSLRMLATKLPADIKVYAGHDYDKDPCQSLSSLLQSNPVLWDMPKETWVRKFGG